jgi:dTDP-4-dehydrorhamnose 3,5-epimerase
MIVERLALAEVVKLTPKRLGDTRGFFSETWNERLLADHGITARFVQDNHSRSASAGTVRGIHMQLPPRAQGKLVRVVRGAILDIAVDLRPGSPTFGKHVAATLSEENWAQLWVPEGFGHGFCTLEPGTEVVYKVTDTWDAASECSIRWDDPVLGLPWPVTAADAVLSDKDRVAPLLAEALPRLEAANWGAS